MELNTIKDTFDRVAKKQKLSTSKSQELIDHVGREIEQTLSNIQSVQDPAASVDEKSKFSELNTKLGELSAHKTIEGSQKELNVNITKYQKLLEKMLNPDTSKACRNVDFDPHIVNQIITSHFYLEGQFDMADLLIGEAGEPEAISLRVQFMEMHQILKALKSRNLGPALNWVLENRARLKESGSDIELKLHGLQFVDILRNKSLTEALNYARTYLAPLANVHVDEIQKFMACLLWAGKLESSPYADLLSPTHWEKLAEDITKQFCSFLGQSHQSPLGITVNAGAEALPALLKLANVMAGKKQEWQTMKHLPVPLELGEEFQFHSVFVCPVSKDQGTEENPPMLLPCGHVLCKQSIHKLSKSNTRAFKCPYCPVDASAAQCSQLFF